MNSNIFEAATRAKLRFATHRGNIGTEDLWDLTLEDLDTVAKSLNKQVKESSEESFIKKQSSGNRTLVLKFELVVYVINIKLTEAEKRKTMAERRAKQNQLLELISQKENDALSRKSIANLRAELEKLEVEEEETVGA